MTYFGNSTSTSTPYQIHYKHIITPNTYEVVDEFIVTNKYKKTDSGPSTGNLISQ